MCECKQEYIKQLERRVNNLCEIIRQIAPMAWEAENPKPERVDWTSDSYIESWYKDRETFLSLLESQLQS